MSLAERHDKGNHRVNLFRGIFGILLTSLLITLGYHQLVESRNYQLMEEEQAQRRILTPGSRGDVYDRKGRLLVGNRPRFSAVIYLDDLRNEFHRTYLSMVRRARKAKAKIKSGSSLEAALRMIAPSGIRRKGFIEIAGKGILEESRIVTWQNQRHLVKINGKGQWQTTFDQFDPDLRVTIEPGKDMSQLTFEVAGLCEMEILRKNNDSWELDPEKDIRIDGGDLRWESRLAVIRKYLRDINRITDRDEQMGRQAFERHFNRRLLLPLRLADDLTSKEYARLIENLPVDSPVQILTEATRHYPYGSAAAHVLGFVSGARKIDGDTIPGSKLATVSFKGKTGKTGIEKYFNEHLSGNDGGEIWHVDPIGYQYERVLHKAPSKGKPLQLSLDVELQMIAEKALSDEIQHIASKRQGNDKAWLEIVSHRALRSLSMTQSLNEDHAKALVELMRQDNRPLSSKEIIDRLGLDLSQEALDVLFEPLLRNGALIESSDSGSWSKYTLSPPPPPPGAIVALNIKTGEILAMVSKPDYNLNDLSPRISPATFRDIQRRGAWLPRAIHPGYPPASTYKLMTAIGALRSGTSVSETTAICEGQYKGMECHVFPGRHGEMSMVNAIAQSCNVYFFQIGERAGHDALIAESKRFGMNERPAIQLPDVPDKPLVPDPSWKKRKIGVEWALEDTLNVSIGQGGFKLSPLQIACFTASLARGETRTIPTLLYREQNAPQPDHGGEPIDLTPMAQEAIKAGMAKSAEVGTSRRCKVQGVKIAGKTGTGQWRNNNMKLNVAWFTAFAPLDNPEIAVVVLVEGVVPQDNIGGGTTAAPVAQKVLQKYFE
jgi:cell division protein FtsI/penicillin-binding protein 2